jgi:hypothetical protein
VAATLNTPQGKGKQVVDHGEGTSSHFKKKKNDKHCRDNNFVAAVERKASRPKGNPGKPTPTRDHFEKLLDAPCPHHEVPVNHMLRVPANEELRQKHPQAEDARPARQARPLPRQR